jgi:hypothetical protein
VSIKYIWDFSSTVCGNGLGHCALGKKKKIDWSLIFRRKSGAVTSLRWPRQSCLLARSQQLALGLHRDEVRRAIFAGSRTMSNRSIVLARESAYRMLPSICAPPRAQGTSSLSTRLKAVNICTGAQVEQSDYAAIFANIILLQIHTEVPTIPDDAERKAGNPNRYDLMKRKYW